MTKAFIFYFTAIVASVIALIIEAGRAGYEHGYDKGIEDTLQMLDDSLYRGDDE